MGVSSLEIIGLSRADAADLAEVLLVEPRIEQIGRGPVRGAGELVSAAFILGVMSAAPAILAQLNEFFSRVRESKHVKFKLSLDGGQTLLEGAATPDGVEKLIAAMKSSASGQA